MVSLFLVKLIIFLIKLKPVFARDYLTVTRSPEQCNVDLITEEEIGKLCEDEGGIIVFEGMVESKQKTIIPFFIGIRHKDIDVQYLYYSYFELKKYKKNNSNTILLFKQTTLLCGKPSQRHFLIVYGR